MPIMACSNSNCSFSMDRAIGKVLVTGCAGFIGFHTVSKLLDTGYNVIGTDCASVITPTTHLKPLRLQYMLDNFGNNFQYRDANFEKMEDLNNIWDMDIDAVIHLGARAGVRESTTDPAPYIYTNCVGHFNVLEMCRRNNVAHFVYASSSSVYGNNSKIPFKETESCDEPLSLYAATKKSTELMSYTYSHLYKLACTGLRFFTVYGPWGRPDMAVYTFADKIISGEPIALFNGGNNVRAFTYIDDVVDGIIGSMQSPPRTITPYRVMNIGTTKQNTTNELVELLEINLGINAVKTPTNGIMCDMRATGANLDKVTALINYTPKIDLAEGIARFIKWYKEFHNMQ